MQTTTRLCDLCGSNMDPNFEQKVAGKHKLDHHMLEFCITWSGAVDSTRKADICPRCAIDLIAEES